jgi:hypothetical protein
MRTNAQHKTIIVEGKVEDSSARQVLEPASVNLLRLPAYKLLRQAVSGENGFSFRAAPGNYALITTFIGYKADTTELKLTAKDSAVSVNVYMAVSGSALMEVVVRANIPPMSSRKDTLVYNVDAYKTRANATVEDLLKKLPGIEVDQDGNILFQGKKVESVLIDGKRFFLNDPRIATQNLTADMIASVEAFDARSDKAKYTGIADQNPNKTLNLKLKKDKKLGWTGNVQGDLGTERTRGARAVFTRLQGSPQVFGQFHTNGNILQTTTNGNLGFRSEWGKNLVAAINYMGSQANSNGQTTSFRQSFLADSSLSENRLSQSVSKNSFHSMSAEIEWAPDPSNKFIIRPMANISKGNTRSTDTVSVMTNKPTGTYLSSRGFTENTSSNTGYSLGGNVGYNHIFKKTGRFFYADLGLSANHQDQQAGLYSRLDTYTPGGSVPGEKIVDQQQPQQTRSSTYNISATYTEPLDSAHIFNLSYSQNYSANHSDKKGFNYDSASKGYDIPDTTTTNDFSNTNTTRRMDIGYNVSLKKFRYQVGLGAQQNSLTSINNTRQTTLKQNILNWYPGASLDYFIARGKNLSIRYNGGSNAPSIDQLQPVPDLSNPYLVTVGNPGLQPEFNHAGDLSFNAVNPKTFSSLNIGLSGNYTMNRITPSSIILPGGIQQLQYVNVNGIYNLGLNATCGFPLVSQKFGNGNLSTHLNYNHNKSFANGTELVQTGLNWSGDLALNFHYADKLYLEAHAGLRYAGSNYQDQPALNTSQLAQQYAFDISYTFPAQLRLRTNCNWQLNGRQGTLPATQVTLWNASLSKNVFRNNRGEILLAAQDLLDNGNGFQQSSGPDFISTSRSNSIGRVLIFSFIYRFKAFSNRS